MSAKNNGIILMTPAETIGAVYKLGGSFECRDDKLIIHGITTADLPETVKAAVASHKPTIYRLVTAFGGRWPTGRKGARIR